MKNKEIRNLILLEIILFISMIIINIFISVSLYKISLKNIVLNNSYIVGNILEKYPDLESDVIDSILIKDNYELGNNVLSKYNLNNMNSVSNDYLNKIILYNVASLSIFFILMFTVNMVFIKNNYKKIKKIDLYMNDILEGNYKVDIKDYLEGDISNLKNDTYKMTVKLREQSELLLKEKKYLEELLEDISHQVKTPLTSMYMINDILLNENDEKIRHDFALKNKKQLERLEWLISSLLKISRLDSGMVKFNSEVVKISTLVTKSIEPIQELIELKNINVIYNLKNASLNVDVNWVKEAILNIVKNAVEHTKDTIIIKSSTNPLYTSITIENNGPCIKKEDLPHIFERFYKGNSESDSIGIGLNMSKKIMEKSNGIIEVKTNDSSTIFILKFYK